MGENSPLRKDIKIDVSYNLIENLKALYEDNAGISGQEVLNEALENYKHQVDGDGSYSFEGESEDPVKETLNQLEKSLEESDFDGVGVVMEDLSYFVRYDAKKIFDKPVYDEFQGYYKELRNNLGNYVKVQDMNHINSQGKNS